MTALRRYWAPKSAPSNVQMILAVDRGKATDKALDEAVYRSLMAAKVQKLVAEAGPQATVAALEMSVETMPELAAIRANEPQKDWPTAMMNSESMMGLMNKIDWMNETGNRPVLPTQAEIKSALHEQTLDELIEQL